MRKIKIKAEFRQIVEHTFDVDDDSFADLKDYIDKEQNRMIADYVSHTPEWVDDTYYDDGEVLVTENVDGKDEILFWFT